MVDALGDAAWRNQLMDSVAEAIDACFDEQTVERSASSLPLGISLAR